MGLEMSLFDQGGFMLFEIEFNREVRDFHLWEFSKDQEDRLELDQEDTKQTVLNQRKSSMSTYYECRPLIPFKTLRENLPAGLDVYVSDELKDLEVFAIRDADGAYLWVYPCKGKEGSCFVRYGMNNVNSILRQLADCFGVTFKSEHELWPENQGRKFNYN
jgi:hypothetical protein